MSETIRGMEELLARLAEVRDLRRVKGALLAAGEHLKGAVSVYPPVKRLTLKEVYGQSFKTERQRRGFFAKLRSGEIEVPYHRGESPGSQRLKAGWAVAAENDGLTVVVGNDATYGPLAQDREQQSLYLRRVGWVTIQDTLAAEGDHVLGLLSDAVEDSLKGG